MRAPRLRQAALWWLTASLSLAIAVFSGEMLIRLWDWGHGVTAPYTHNLPESIAIPNGYFNFDLQPNLSIVYDAGSPRRISINRWGFRGADYDPIKPAGVTRVFCFGGSSTFDPFVPDDRTWVSLLGAKLSERLGRPVEAVNAGRYGYTTWEIVGLLYQRVLRHSPDIIIIYSTFNDARVDISPFYGRDEGPQLYGRPLLGLLNKNSALFAFLDYRLRHVWPTAAWYDRVLPTYIRAREIPREHYDWVSDPHRRLAYIAEGYRRNLHTIVRIARDNQVGVLLSTQIVNRDDNTRQVRRISHVVREVAAEEQVPILDLDRLAVDDPKGAGLLYTYVHLSPAGCEFVSDQMAAAVELMTGRPHAAREEEPRGD